MHGWARMRWARHAGNEQAVQCKQPVGPRCVEPHLDRLPPKQLLLELQQRLQVAGTAHVQGDAQVMRVAGGWKQCHGMQYQDSAWQLT